MSLKKLKNQSKYVLIIFMILQPIFDIYYLYGDNVIAFFKFSPATILRMLFILYLGITTFLLVKKKLNYKYLFVFFIIYFLYTILHLYNATLFDSTILRFQDYSISREIFYLIRMFCPLLLILVASENKLEFADLKKIILTIYLIFSVTIVVTNLLGVSLTSYADGNKIIKANFLTWFNPLTYEKYGYEYLASKGIFHMANQISGVMTMLFPLLMYIILKDKFKILNIVTLFLTMLSMLMVGTRIASLGMLAVFIASVIMYFFFRIIQKEKITFDKKYIFIVLFFVLSILFYPYTPVANRVYVGEGSADINERIRQSGADVKFKNLKAEIKELELKATSASEKAQIASEIEEKKIAFIRDNYEIYGMDSIYVVDLYPYEEDPDFWFMMFDVPFTERADHRQIKEKIMTHIYNLNDNFLDSLVGYSFTRPRNAMIYMENDIYVHFFTIGILGIIIFILPYLFIVIYAFLKMLKQKKHFNYLNLTYIMCILLTYLIGYLTGNIFDEWLVTLFLGIITGLLYANITKIES